MATKNKKVKKVKKAVDIIKKIWYINNATWKKQKE